MEQAEFLKTIPLFEQLELAEIEGLIPDLELLSYEDGEIIFQQDDPGDRALIVAEGVVVIEREIAPGVYRTLKMGGTGTVFGELALVDRRPRSARARAREKVGAVGVPASLYDRIMEERPAIGLRLSSYLSRLIATRLRDTTDLYAEAVNWGLETTGARSLGLHELATDTPDLVVGTLTGQALHGRLLMVDTSGVPGARLVLKSPQGDLTMVPYHAIQYLRIGS